jgi:hypothetical protein
VATVAIGPLVSVRSVATGRELRRLENPADSLKQCLAFSPDGAALAASGSDGDLLLWDLGRSIDGAESARGAGRTR